MKRIQQDKTALQGSNGSTKTNSPELEAHKAPPSVKATPACQGDPRLPPLDDSPSPFYLEQEDNYSRVAEYEAVVARLLSLGFENEAKAVDSCAKMSQEFKCEGEQLFNEGESTYRRHVIQARIFCGKAYCPRCGAYKSEIHLRRANRLYRQLFGVRGAKWVITLPELDREFITKPEDVKSLMDGIAAIVQTFHKAFGVKVAVHWLGDRTQGIHFEVWFPYHGVPMAPDNLKRFREELAEGLGLTEIPVAKFKYNGLNRLDERQARDWFHLLKYMAHPSLPTQRFLELDDDDVRKFLGMVGGFRTIRGYGVLSDSRIKKAIPDLRCLYPMPDIGEDADESDSEKVVLFDGAPCPSPGCRTAVEIVGIKHSLSGGDEIAPGIFLHEIISPIERVTDLTFLLEELDRRQEAAA